MTQRIVSAEQWARLKRVSRQRIDLGSRLAEAPYTARGGDLEGIARRSDRGEQRDE